MINHWLIKSEGNCYSIDDLKKDTITPWTGVRNYQARNFMRDSMKIGDLVLFYHSNSKPSGIYGIARVASKSHVDETQFNKKDMHFDASAHKETPRWYCVDVVFVTKFPHPISLDIIKFDPQLSGMMVRQQGSRLSVQPVSQKHFDYIKKVLTK